MFAAVPNAQNRASRACVRGPKTRAGNFFRQPPKRARRFAPQVANSRRVAWPAATKTASGRRNFLNADPIGFAGGLNWYAYANGNPVMFSDPSGYVAWGDLGSATLGIAGNGLGLATGFLLGIAPEPTMVTKVAAVVVVGKSSYGFGVSAQNFWAALKDESPVSKGSLANDVADLVAPGNQNAQYAATAIDLASDLALGRIGANHAQSLVGRTVRGANGFPLYDMQYQTVNSFERLETVADAFTMLSVGQTGYDAYRDMGLPPFGASIGGGGSGGGGGSMTKGRK